MKKSKKVSVKVEGNARLFGRVKISGDPYQTVFLSALSLFLKQPIQITNVPRCLYVMKFFETLNNIGVKTEWIDSASISVEASHNIDSNIVQLYEANYLDYAKLLIPGLLKRNQECALHPNLKSIAKLYKDFNFDVSETSNIITVKMPDLKNLKLGEKKDTNFYDKVDVASELLLRRLISDFDFELTNGQEKFRYLISKEGDKFNTPYYVGPNITEFDLFSFLAIFSDGELEIETGSFTSLSDRLLAYNLFNVEYEITKNVLKIWKTSEPLQEYFNLENFDISEIAYFLILLSYFSEKSIKVVTKNSEKISELCKDLNILGFRVNYAPQKDSALVEVRPSKGTPPFKSTCEDIDSCGVMFALAILAEGNHTILNADKIISVSVDLLAKLKKIGAKIKLPYN